MTALSWSGGKDSALALWTLRRRGVEPRFLLTTVDEESGRVPHHGVSGDLLARQAEATGLELVTIGVPDPAPNEVYEARLRDAFARPPLADIGTVAFGDLFLADLRAYRERRMAEAGLAASFPLWGSDTCELARAFVDAGFKSVIVSVDGDQLPHDFLGRELDHDLLDDLPPHADPCGENGEFHTFVYDGPVFDEPIAVGANGRRDGGRFAWLDLVAA
jgi:uncharacterized protein (TIGR00290 family)